MEDFNSDLQQSADIAETYFFNQIASRYPTAKRTTGYCHYDIYVPDYDELIFECKYDGLSKTTGNIAVEYECNGKPSGVMLSEPVWLCYIYYKDGERWQVYIRKDDLKMLLDSYPLVDGGQQNPTKIKLFPVDLIGVSSLWESNKPVIEKYMKK